MDYQSGHVSILNTYPGDGLTFSLCMKFSLPFWVEMSESSKTLTKAKVETALGTTRGRTERTKNGGPGNGDDNSAVRVRRVKSIRRRVRRVRLRVQPSVAKELRTRRRG